MAEFYDKDMELCNEEETQYALIDIKEYNGLRKVLRLYQDQKEGKTKKSDSRYKVLSQQRYKHQDDRSKFYGWETIVLTPYLSDLDYEEVQHLVQSDWEGYLGVIAFCNDTFGINNTEIKTSIEIQNYRMGN